MRDLQDPWANARPVARGLQLALSRIADDGSYFARASDIRLWSIVAKGVPAEVWPRVAEALERQPGVREVFLCVDEPFGRGTEGLDCCARRLVEAWQRRCCPAAEPAAGHVSPPAVDFAPSGTPHQALARAVQSLALSVRAPREGIVVMLAAMPCDTNGTLEATLAAFVHSPALARVRWVLVNQGGASQGGLGEGGGASVFATDARVPEDDFADGIEAVFSPIEDGHESRGEAPAVPAAVAVPRPSPSSGIVPRRISVPPPPADPRADELAAVGIPPELVAGGSAPRLRRCLLEAANAARRSRLSDAVQWQKQACEVTARLGMAEADLGARMVLAGYLEAGRRPEHALREYQQAAQLALARGDVATAADALLHAARLEVRSSSSAARR